MSNQIDWSGIRAAAVVIGVREAARRAAINLEHFVKNRTICVDNIQQFGILSA